MVCKTCGSQLTEQDKFCRYCGTTVDTAPQQSAPIYTPQPQNNYVPQNSYEPQPQNAYAPQNTYIPQPQASYAPQPEAPRQPRAKGAHLKSSAPKKGGKKGLIIGGSIAAAVLVIALVAVLIFTGSATVQVGNAFRNTASTFAKISDVWNAEEAAAIGQQEAVSMTYDVQLDTIDRDIMYGMVGYYYYSDEEVDSFCQAVSGLGIRMDMDVDLANREIGALASVHKGSADLITGIVAAEDEMLYVGLPEFLDDFYGVNTETAMADLEAMGADLGEAAQLSFNIFDLIDIVKRYSPDPAELEAEMTAVLADVAKDIEIEKEGKKTFKVGGESLSCKAYTVTVPQDALEEILDVIVDASETDPIAMVGELCEAMHLPDYVTEEVLYEMGYSFSAPDYSDLYEVLDVLEDIELTVYVKSGKVAGIVYEKKIDGSKLELTFGIGGDHYGDVFEIEVKIDGEKLTIESEGDHTARKGVFTDKATIKFDGEKLTMNTEYDPKSGALEMKLGDDQASFRVEGIYLVEDNKYTLDLDEFSLTVEGAEQLSFRFLYEVSAYEKRVKVSDAKLLSHMDQEDIMSIASEVEGNAMEWAVDFMAKYPELMGLLNAM